MQKTKVTAIIVHYKRYDLLLKCIKSLKLQKGNFRLDIIVIDNDEKKTISGKLKNIEYHKAPGNIGFGAAVNLGASYATGEYLLILNPDTEFKPGAIAKMLTFIKKRKSIGIVGPSLLSSTGEEYTQLGSKALTPIRAIFALSIVNRIWPNNPISRQYYLKDERHGKEIEVDVVPGSVFLIRDEVFSKVNGFDPKFFLYFEESDLCRRVKSLDYKIFILPSPKVVHHWGKSTDTDSKDKIKEIFAKSRFYYFKKNYGYICALIVEFATRFGKVEAYLFLITLVSLLLRFWDFHDRIAFHGELGHNYLAMRTIWENKIIPLVGPPTSHTWLSFGPLFYWIATPLLALVKFEPAGLAFIMSLIHAFLPAYYFYSLRKIYGSNKMLLASSILAISPLFIWFSREARFFSLVLIFIPLLIKYIFTKSIFRSFFLFSIMLHFHLSPLILLPSLIYFLIVKNITYRNLIKGFLGLFIPFTPYFVHMLINSPSTLYKLILWFPYRLAGFLGFVTIPTGAYDSVAAASGYLQFFTQILANQGALAMVTTLSILLIFILRRKSNREEKLIAWLLVSGLVGIIIHGNPPVHYFLPVLPIAVMGIAIVLSRYIVVSCVLIIVVLFINWSFYFGGDERFEKGLVPYIRQRQIMQEIVSVSEGRKFSILREGPFDYFEEDYAQNYIYLAWLFGNKPEPNSDLMFKIVEKEGKIFYEKN